MLTQIGTDARMVRVMERQNRRMVNDIQSSKTLEVTKHHSFYMTSHHHGQHHIETLCDLLALLIN